MTLLNILLFICSILNLLFLSVMPLCYSLNTKPVFCYIFTCYQTNIKTVNYLISTLLFALHLSVLNFPPYFDLGFIHSKTFYLLRIKPVIYSELNLLFAQYSRSRSQLYSYCQMIALRSKGCTLYERYKVNYIYNQKSVQLYS